jgi:phosphopentomutase
VKRGLLLVLDSLGLGGARDAAAFGDEGANTLGHLAAACARGEANREGCRRGPLRIPHLEQLGLGAAAHRACGHWPAGLVQRVAFTAAHGCADEVSLGKDTPSGHWEMAGLPVDFAWGRFPPGPPSFPEALLRSLIERGGVPGILGNCAESGTVIIDRLGAEHVATGKPIVYTSADSVIQIAAHEQVFGLERLYTLCEVARELADPYRVGRVIARPFTGRVGTFERTPNRRDYTTPPHGSTLLDALDEAGGQVVAIGKIRDVFAGRGIATSVIAHDNDEVFDATLDAWTSARDRTLVFANFVDFDMLHGHRRDVAGYAHALEAFDERLPELLARLEPGDLLVLTADHGCDPTWRGTDHTRERVPILVAGPGVQPIDLGVRDTFADIGQTLARHFALAPLPHGRALLAVE